MLTFPKNSYFFTNITTWSIPKTNSQKFWKQTNVFSILDVFYFKDVKYVSCIILLKKYNLKDIELWLQIDFIGLANFQIFSTLFSVIYHRRE